MLVMLLQSILGLSDEQIVNDYYLSNKMLEDEGSAAVDGIRKRGKLDRKFFSGANREAMVATLKFLRGKYGSISPGYLDSIGFNSSWRRRLEAVLRPQTRSRL